jgi:hypothetical protein
MNQEEALKDFFTSFKISLKNASIYHKEHPAFIKSVEELKQKIDGFLLATDPIKFGFTSNSLLFEGRYWEEDKIFREIAKIFHFRKVKSLEIRGRLSNQELATFMAKFHLHPKDIFRAGGLKKILNKEKTSHLKLEELDYSQLLKGEGDEVKDVWTYLLDEAVGKQDQQSMQQVADNFERIAGHLNPQDFIEDEELPANIHKLMSYIKKTKESQFHSCAKVLVKAFVKNKKMVQESKLDKLRIIFSDIEEEDFASALWEEIATDDDFDALSFSIFTKLTEKDKQQRIAGRLEEMATKKDSLSDSSELRKKIKDLLSGTSSPYISEIYRETLSSLLKNISFQKERSLNRALLQRNFRLALLNLFHEEPNKTNLLVKVIEEWEEIKKDKDFEFLKHLSSSLKKQGVILSDALVIKTNKMIANFVERAILAGDTSPYLDYFLTTLDRSNLGVNPYLHKIFTARKVTPSLLQFFFKFFPDQILYFNINLEESASDSKFLDRLTESLKLVDSPISLDVLKTIYAMGNNYIKIKVLRAMQQISFYDEDFLLPILKKSNYYLKKEALLNLVRHEATKDNALEILFSISSPFGIKNRVLRKHLRMVKETNLSEAHDSVFALSQRKDFWNRKLRREAERVLEVLDGRKD